MTLIRRTDTNMKILGNKKLDTYEMYVMTVIEGFEDAVEYDDLLTKYCAPDERDILEKKLNGLKDRGILEFY